MNNETYFNSVNHFLFFSWNFPDNFMDAFGSPDNHIRKHIQEKFDEAYKKAGAKYCMIEFYSHLDQGNRQKLVQWAKDYYHGEPLIN